MPLYPDITPDWLRPENRSVFDSPAMSGLKSLAGLMGADDPAGSVMQTALPSPLMASQREIDGLLAKYGRKFFHSDVGIDEKISSLAKVAPIEVVDEIMSTNKLYNLAKETGDPAAMKIHGKRLAELDRIGRTGRPYTPSTDSIMSKPPPVGEGLDAPPSKVISNTRLKAALEGLKGKK